MNMSWSLERFSIAATTASPYARDVAAGYVHVPELQLKPGQHRLTVLHVLPRGLQQNAPPGESWQKPEQQEELPQHGKPGVGALGMHKKGEMPKPGGGHGPPLDPGEGNVGGSFGPPLDAGG
jgi:hypothetical protein